MSLENLELIRADYEEFRQTGRPPLQRLHPNVEWHTAADLIDGGVLRDRAAVGAFVQAYMDAFEGFRLDVVGLIDGGEYVVACLVFSGRVQGSVQEVSVAATQAWKLREEVVVEVREYRTREQALDALALSA
jgi:ketosteroid isomerase-like protein